MKKLCSFRENVNNFDADVEKIFSVMFRFKKNILSKSSTYIFNIVRELFVI